MRKLALVLTVPLLALSPSLARAQVDLGGQLSWADDADWGLGARVTVGLPVETIPLQAIGSFDFFFPDGPVDYWEINANIAYLIPVQSVVIVPYVGTGFNIAHVELDSGGLVEDVSDTDLGLNLLGGIRFTGTAQPFVEVRVELGGGEQVVLTGGVTFNVGPGF